MRHPVAPGSSGYNLLSKRGLFRVALLRAAVHDHDAHALLVLEAEDGSYRFEHRLSDARVDGDCVVFDFHVVDRARPYRCYFKGESAEMRFARLPAALADLGDGAAPEGAR